MAAIKKSAPKGAKIVVPQIAVARFKITLVGLTTLIVNKWSEKATEMMRAKQQGKASMKKDPKNPEECFQAAKYLDAKGRDCLHSQFFKNAIVSAARYCENVKMTELRGALFVVGDLIPLKYSKVVMREDHVRVGMGTADLRYRPEYHDWSIEITVEYNSAIITPDQIVNLIQLAGFSVGLCEWRPECNGDHGRFQIDPKSMKEVKQAA